ncbi:hypothetical protein CQZ98_17660 [Pseudomonas sp. MYb115]|nr:hypothetical protein CQZ98_17660 [Pseudomonas sp. MYb115]
MKSKVASTVATLTAALSALLSVEVIFQGAYFLYFLAMRLNGLKTGVSSLDGISCFLFHFLVVPLRHTRGSGELI